MTSTIELDDIDRRILAVLSEDPKLSARAVARGIGMSPGAVTERIARLEQRGVILGSALVLNAGALGYGVHAIVGVQVEHPQTFDEAIDYLMSIPEVEALHIVTGRWDLLLELRVRDNHHLLDVLTRTIVGVPGFQHSETMLSLKSITRPGGWKPPGLHPVEKTDREE